jgi:magnesium-protoporphyrin O-methyltransferase
LELDTSGISCCFDDESTKMVKDYRKKGLGQTSKAILSALSSRGLSGSSVLELGCGPGALTLELLKRGAASALGIDLSPKMVEAARSLASEAGLSTMATFRLGDGAGELLPSSDFVILDSVICCYPDAASLVKNSSSASRRYYAIAVPDDKRPLTRLLKRLLPIQRLFTRRSDFRFFIHSTESLVRQLQDKGFELAVKTPAGWIWSVFVFAAPKV